MAAEMNYSSTYKFFFKSLMYFALVLLGCCGDRAVGMVTLSPMMVAPVCCVGDSLQITCTASVEFIRWSIVVVNEHGMEEEITVSRNSRDPTPQPRDRIINSTTFTFSRTSAEDALPLISTLSINSTSVGLNGTVVNCMDANNPVTSNSTIVYIIDTSNNLNISTMNIVSEDYSADNVIVTVELDQQVGVTYIARILPLATVFATGSNSQQLILLYNTEYNLSVVAVTPCGHATAFIRLSYVNCGHPDLVSNNSQIPIIESYDGLPVEGSIIRFSCPTGLQLTGPNSAICTGNGEWEPDINGLMCNVTCGHPLRDRESGGNDSILVMGYKHPAVEGAVVIFGCPPQYVLVGSNSTTCMGNGEWEPDPREVECKGLEEEKNEESKSTNDLVLTIAASFTVVVFVVISILAFVAGFTCGHYFGRKYTKATSRQPVALCEDMNVLPSAVEHQEQHFELKENVAYGPLKSIELH